MSSSRKSSTKAGSASGTIDAAKAAAEALKDLNMFYAIIALCEHSLFSADSHRGEAEIIRICKRHSAACLDRYDSAMKKLQDKQKEQTS